jgi:hypothetical protein
MRIQNFLHLKLPALLIALFATDILFHVVHVVVVLCHTFLP